MKRLLACALLLGCGGGSNPLSPDASGGTTGNYCTYTLTGAINATYQCKALVSGSSNAPSSTNVVISAYLNGVPIAGVASQWTLHDGLALSTGGYSQDEVAEVNSIVTTGMNVWDMSKGADDQQNHPDVGVAGLSIRSPGTQVTAGDVTVWQHVQGHAEVDLPADTRTGASGTVRASIDFTDSDGVGGTGSNPDGGAVVPDAGVSPDGGGSSSCVMTFTGGFNATADCVASGNNTSGLGQFRVNERSNPNAGGADAARFHSASAGYSQQGQFMTGTFTTANTLGGAADLQTTDSLHWTGYGGTYTITDTGPSMTFGSTTVFGNPHGSYTGTLTLTGQADVQVSITF